MISALVSNKEISPGRITAEHFLSPELAIIEQVEGGRFPVKPIAAIGKVRGGKRLAPNSRYVPSGIPYVRSTDIRDLRVHFSQAVYISTEQQKRIARYPLEYGDVTITIAGTIGAVGVVDEKFEQCHFNENLARITQLGGLNPWYLAVYLDSKLGQAYISYLVGGAVQPKLSLNSINKIRVPVPPRPIQDRIAKVMQAAYATRREKLAEAARVEASVNEHILQRLGINWSEVEDVKRFVIAVADLRGSRFDVRYRSPKANHALALLEKSGHTVTTLGKMIAQIHYGASVTNDYADQGIPFIRISNLKPNEIDTSDIVYFEESKRDILGKAFVQASDLLMSRSGSVGIVAVVPPELDGFAFGSFQIKFRLRDGSANPFFIAYFLNSPLGNAQVEQQKTGSIQMNITIEGIKALQVPLLSIELQNEIVQEADVRRVEAKRLHAEAESVVVEAKARVERMILGEETP